MYPHHSQEAEVKRGSEQSLGSEGDVLGPCTGVVEGKLRSNDLRARVGEGEGKVGEDTPPFFTALP